MDSIDGSLNKKKRNKGKTDPLILQGINGYPHPQLSRVRHSAACQSSDRDARCQSFIRCQSQSAAGWDGSLPHCHQGWRKQCVETRKDESGAEDARHPADVSREEITRERAV